MKDILIIGAGPSGLAAAIRAKQLGATVTVIEKCDAEAEKVCGDGLTEKCVAALEHLGVSTDDLIQHEANEIRSSLRIFETHRFELPHPERSYFTLRRKELLQILRNRAETLGATILYQTPYRKDMKAAVVIDASGCSEKRPCAGKTYPMGMSAVIAAETGLCSDKLYFVYPDASDRSYCWAFPLSGEMWNVGVWNTTDPKRLKPMFAWFQTAYLDRFFRNQWIVRGMRGARLGTIVSETPICPGAVSCGDAAGLCSSESGEGISYALQSGCSAVDLAFGQT